MKNKKFRILLLIGLLIFSIDNVNAVGLNGEMSFLEKWGPFIFIFLLMIAPIVEVLFIKHKFKNPAEFKDVTDFSNSLYILFENTINALADKNYEQAKLALMDDLYNDSIKRKWNKISSHDNTKLISYDISSSDSKYVEVEYLVKVIDYENNKKSTNKEDYNLDKVKYLVKFIQKGEAWKIESIEEEFIKDMEYDHDKIVDSSLLEKYVGDKDKFLEDRFNDYVAIQEAWSNFDYNVLRSKLTDELYNQFEMQLSIYKLKNQKNIISNFEKREYYIESITEEKGIVKVDVILEVTEKNYVEENGKYVKGNDEKLIENFKLTFIHSLTTEEIKCPNCGNPLSEDHSQVCQFCHNKISLTTDKWVLSKKENI